MDRSPTLLILASLAGGPKHGYAMVEDVAAVVGVRLGPGTLYGALARLEEQGLIEAVQPAPEHDRRQPYRLTPTGATHLKEQCDQLERLAQFGRSRLLQVQSAW